MKMKALPAEERPLEKGLFKGMETLSNAELLALIINSGTRNKSALSLAEEVLGVGNGISGLYSMTAEELMDISGIGKGKAVRIMASLELGKRANGRTVKKAINVSDPEAVAGLFMDELRHLKKETFRVLLLNAKGDVISVETISVGELTSTLVHPREVFCYAVKKSAAAVILVHNHPSGDATPSSEDVETTLRLMECGKLMGIRVLDHLVIGDGTFTSIRAAGFID